MENATLVVLGLIAIFAAAVAIIRLRQRRQEKLAATKSPRHRRPIPSETGVVPAAIDPTVDPMDPRGDGTIQPGDQLWEVFQKTMEGDGNVVFGNRRDDGAMEIEVYPMDEDSDAEERRNG